MDRLWEWQFKTPFPHARRVSCSERLCENPEFANRVPTAGQDRAPAMHSGPTSVSIRASPKGQVPTGPTFHTVWRVVRRRGATCALLVLVLAKGPLPGNACRGVQRTAARSGEIGGCRAVPYYFGQATMRTGTSQSGPPPTPASDARRRRFVTDLRCISAATLDASWGWSPNTATR